MRLPKLFALWLAVCAIAKMAFIIVCANEHVSVADALDVWRHGLPMDAATAAYLLALPAVAGLITAVAAAAGWHAADTWRRAGRTLMAAYQVMAAAILVVAILADMALYPFWGFKLDATVLNYIDSPRDAIASVPLCFVATYIVAAAALTALTALAAIRICNSRQDGTPTHSTTDGRRNAATRHRLMPVAGHIAAVALLAVVMRGGVKESTMNVGNAYFSQRTFLNHAAVNPLFSFISSLGKADDFRQLYRAMPDDEAHAIVETLYPTPQPATQQATHDAPRPSVLLIIWEGCAAYLTAQGAVLPHDTCITGNSDIVQAALKGYTYPHSVTPCLDSLAATGVCFTQLRANSFRTDRGVLSILSGHISYPTHSLMKMAARAGKLPSLARTLHDAGYDTDFAYGGDINFTNMKGYLLSTGFESVTADMDFNAEARHTAKWGVCDSILCEHIYSRLTATTPTADTRGHKPLLQVALTLSSHEPWDVPGADAITDDNDRRRNAFAYTDRQIGRLVKRLRQTPLWDNLLVIILPDHGVNIDAIQQRENPLFFYIPMVWTGGALTQLDFGAHHTPMAVTADTESDTAKLAHFPITIDRLMSQSDLAATLLARLRLPHHDFTWSRDILSDTYTHRFTYSAFNDGFTLTDSTGITVFDNKARRPVFLLGTDPDSVRQHTGQAILQVSYDRLGSDSPTHQ